MERVRIPSLDGVRAVAIALVLLSHLIGTRGFPVTTTPLIDTGALGVRVFFVLSGYLITGLLRDEWARTGRIDLRGFFVRRTLRIFPAFYAYVACIALLGLAGAVAVSGTDLLRAATYTINYHVDRDWLFGHAWSLAVEEQFYLTWPLLVLWLGTRRAPVAALAAMGIAPLVRVTLLALPDGTTPLQSYLGTSFETVADGIATGALLALVGHRLWDWRPYRRFLGSGQVVVLPFIALAAGSLPWWGEWVGPRTAWILTGLHAAAGITVLNVSIAMMIDRVVRFSDGPVGRFLNRPSVAFLGVLSYSLYIWQQFFLDRRSGAWYAHFPQNLLLVLGAALLSWYGVERPALRLRDRFFHPTARTTP